MTISERIRNIANKANTSYRVISDMLNDTYGKSNINFEEKLNLLEKQYGIQ